MSNTPTSSAFALKQPKLKDYMVFYQVTEERCAVVRAASPKQARHHVELYLDHCRPVPASVHIDTQSVVAGVRESSVAIDADGPEIVEGDLPY
jgi:hypothetical protein